MAYLYNFAYLVVIILASPFLIVSSIRNGKYRQGWGAKFLGLFRDLEMTSLVSGFML